MSSRSMVSTARRPAGRRRCHAGGTRPVPRRARQPGSLHLADEPEPVEEAVGLARPSRPLDPGGRGQVLGRGTEEGVVGRPRSQSGARRGARARWVSVRRRENSSTSSRTAGRKGSPAAARQVTPATLCVKAPSGGGWSASQSRKLMASTVGIGTVESVVLPPGRRRVRRCRPDEGGADLQHVADLPHVGAIAGFSSCMHPAGRIRPPSPPAWTRRQTVAIGPTAAPGGRPRRAAWTPAGAHGPGFALRGAPPPGRMGALAVWADLRTARR